MAADPLAFLWEAVIEQMMIPFEELFFGSRFQALKKQQTSNTAALNALKAEYDPEVLSQQTQAKEAADAITSHAAASGVMQVGSVADQIQQNADALATNLENLNKAYEAAQDPYDDLVGWTDPMMKFHGMASAFNEAITGFPTTLLKKGVTHGLSSIDYTDADFKRPDYLGFNKVGTDIENWFTGKKKPINVAWTWGTEGKDRSTWFDRNHQGLW